MDWRIYYGDLLAIIDENDVALITLTKQGDLESGNPGFVSGTSGWQIAHGGDAEFNNITARGEFRASIFVIGEMHASGGTLMALGAGKITDTVTTF